MQRRHWIIILIAGAAIIAASAFLYQRGIKSGDAVPNFSLTSVSGETVSLSDLRGKVVVAQFFAAWCGQCMAELPELENFAASLQSDDIRFIAISEDDPADVEFVRNLALSNFQHIIVVFDEDAKVADSFGSYSLPDTYVIGRDGKLVGRFEGTVPLDWKDGRVRDVILGLIKKSGE